MSHIRALIPDSILFQKYVIIGRNIKRNVMKSVVIFDGDGTENRQDPEESKQAVALKIFLLTRFFTLAWLSVASSRES